MAGPPRADWPDRVAAAEAALDGRGARRPARRAAAHRAAVPGRSRCAPPRSMPAEEARAPHRRAAPEALGARPRGRAGRARGLARSSIPGPSPTLWIADGLEHAADGDAAAPFAAALAAAGPLTVARAEGRPARLLPPPRAEADRLVVHASAPRRCRSPTEAVVLARTGDGRTLDRAVVPIPAGATEAEAALDAAARDPQPGGAPRPRGRGRRRAHRAARRALPPPPGRADRRRRGDRGRCAADRRALLPRPRAGPLAELRRGTRGAAAAAAARRCWCWPTARCPTGGSARR